MASAPSCLVSMDIYVHMTHKKGRRGGGGNTGCLSLEVFTKAKTPLLITHASLRARQPGSAAHRLALEKEQDGAADQASRDCSRGKDAKRRSKVSKEPSAAKRDINSSRVKRERIGKTFSGKRKSIRQAVKLGGSSKWIRLRECVR